MNEYSIKLNSANTVSAFHAYILSTMVLVNITFMICVLWALVQQIIYDLALTLATMMKEFDWAIEVLEEGLKTATDEIQGERMKDAIQSLKVSANIWRM